MAYSPLAQGVLTGKYAAENPLPGIRGRRFGVKALAKVAPPLDLMRDIGRTHGHKTCAQVAINWAISSKGTLPIPGAKNARQAEQNAGALGWRLSDEEMTILDAASEGMD
jgi:aryl-alcohol dehydrogenase-like predicted oxidoreductase